MIGQRTRGIQSLLVVTQGTLMVALFWVWLGGYFLINSPIGWREFYLFYDSYPIYCVTLIVGFCFESLTRGNTKAGLYESSIAAKIPLTFRQTAISVFFLFILLVLTKDRFLSRMFLVSFIPGLYLMLLCTNHVLPMVLAHQFFRDSRKEERTLLVGNAERAEKLRDWLLRKSRFGFHCIGILSNDTRFKAVAGMPVLGTPADLDAIIGRENVRQVILLDFLHSTESQRDLLKSIQSHGARLHILSQAAEFLGQPIYIEQDEGFHFITLHEEPLENPLNRLLKRGLDLAVAIPAVLFILPLLTVIVWLLQRLQSPGPVFYTQPRACIQNDEFQILKFRTMKPNNGETAKQATVADDRIYKAGRLLRRFSLDEFPQFINVIRGEMSVVGPRPHLMEHNRQFAEVLQNYHTRAFVKPGITGLAQVRGFRGETRTVEDIRRRLASDLFYLENWSLMLDLGIILRTVWQVFFPPYSAY